MSADAPSKREFSPRPDKNKQTAASLTGPWKPPSDLEAERQVLGSMLLDYVCIPEVVQIVKADDFYLPAHKLIFEMLVLIFDREQLVDLPLLTSELKRKNKLDDVGGVVALANLEQNVFYTGSAPEIARIIANKATLRKLMLAAEEILKDCSEEKRDVEEQVSIAEKRIFDISLQAQTGDFVHIRDIMHQAIEEIGRLHANSGDITGIPTQFIDLDRLLNGLQKSDLLILAARPSIGKTAFALNVALNVAMFSQVPVAIFSLEMGREQLNMRLLCQHARLPAQKVRNGSMRESDFDRLREKATELSKAPIYIDDSPGLSIMQLRTRARRLHSREKIGLIIVDYLQLMSGSEKGGRNENRQQEVSEISRGLKALARELQVPVMALSQLSRNIEQRSGREKNAKPMLSDLRESGAIEQDADIVMFVHRERKEVEKDAEGRLVMDKTLPIDTEIIVGKHRNGPIGSVDLLFWPDFTQFTSKAK